MSRFRWYRRLRGGLWARVPGRLWGWRWVRLHPPSAQHADEDYTELGSVDNYARFRGLRDDDY